MSTRTARHLRWLLCAVTVIVWALCSAYYTIPDRSLWFGALGQWVIAVASCEACVVDAQLRGRPIVRSLWVPMVWLNLVSVPAYLVISRGWRGALLAVGMCIGLLLVACAASFATEFGLRGF